MQSILVYVESQWQRKGCQVETVAPTWIVGQGYWKIIEIDLVTACSKFVMEHYRCTFVGDSEEIIRAQQILVFQLYFALPDKATRSWLVFLWAKSKQNQVSIECTAKGNSTFYSFILHAFLEDQTGFAPERGEGSVVELDRNCRKVWNESNSWHSDRLWEVNPW